MELSIIVPHLSHSKSIDLFKNIIKENTHSKDYEIVSIVDTTDVYKAFNDGVKYSSGDVVVLINDDMFVQKNWDIEYIKYASGKTIVTGQVVEPGLVTGVSGKNIKMNFGDTPDSYERDKFEQWASEQVLKTAVCNNSKGWYMPFAVEKKYFIEYPNEIKFPHANDITLFDDILPKMGYNFIKVNSFCYHLQGFSHIKRK